jgi:hypothetical protein
MDDVAGVLTARFLRFGRVNCPVDPAGLSHSVRASAVLGQSSCTTRLIAALRPPSTSHQMEENNLSIRAQSRL